MAGKREHLTGAAQVKGTMIQAHLNWLAKRGIDPATALAPHLPAEVAKLVSHSVLATSWVPLTSLIAVDRAIAVVAKGSPDDVFRELGRFSATSNLSGIYAGFVSDEPHRFFEKQARLHERFQFKNPKSPTDRQGPIVANHGVSPNPGCRAHPPIGQECSL